MKKALIILFIAALLSGCAGTLADPLKTSMSLDMQSPKAADVDAADDCGEGADEETGSNLTAWVKSTLEQGFVEVSGHELTGAVEMLPRVYLYTDEPILNILVTTVEITIKDGAARNIVTGTQMFVPGLATGQTLRIFSQYPIDYNDSAGSQYTKISYTNSAGELESALLLWERGEEPSLLPVEPDTSGMIYDEAFIGSRDLFPADFRDRMLGGDFDDYVPKGTRIAAGSLGDINDDGIEDAMICLAPDAYNSPDIRGIMPMLLLIGQPGGGFYVRQVIPDRLFLPTTNISYPVAGNGYIDIIYNFFDGPSPFSNIGRFRYYTEESDWLLDEFSYQPIVARSDEGIVPTGLVRALPDSAGLPLRSIEPTFQVYYGGPPDWDFFDAIATLEVPSHDNAVVYTLAVVLDRDAGIYEGYIHLDSGWGATLIQTIRGEYLEGTDITITANEEDFTFTVQEDTWEICDREGPFFYLRLEILG